MNTQKIIQMLLWLIYPFAIFFGLQFLEPWAVAVLLGASLALRRFNDAGRFLKSVTRVELAVFACMSSLVVLTAITNSEILLRLYPAGMSVGMLLIFTMSLIHPPTIIERFARLSTPDLPPVGVLYTRHVTQCWCAFFVVNGALAIFTALYASRETWAIYNGLIVYLIMGTLFVGEWLIRRFFIQRGA